MNEKEGMEKCQEIIKENKKNVKETRKTGYRSINKLSAELDEESVAIETVLNMLKEKDKKIESKNRLLQIVGIELNEAETKIEEKDKIIDLMAENIFEEGIIWDDKEEVKQYFKSKAEKE